MKNTRNSTPAYVFYVLGCLVGIVIVVLLRN